MGRLLRTNRNQGSNSPTPAYLILSFLPELAGTRDVAKSRHEIRLRECPKSHLKSEDLNHESFLTHHELLGELRGMGGAVENGPGVLKHPHVSTVSEMEMEQMSPAGPTACPHSFLAWPSKHYHQECHEARES